MHRFKMRGTLQSSITESGIDRGGRCAVDGGNGKAVLGGVGKDLADVIAGDDAGRDDIEDAHGCNEDAGGGRRVECGD